MEFRTGYHDFCIQAGGLDVFPQTQRVTPKRSPDTEPDVIKSGMDRLDTLLGGGLRAGSSALFVGPTGTGKSTLVSAHACHEALQGRDAVVFLFDEPEVIFHRRLRSLGLVDDAPIGDGRLRVEHVSTAAISTGELSHRVRSAVDDANTRLVVIDGLRGYLQATPAEQRVLVAHLHDLLTYLTCNNVLTLLTATQHGIVSDETKDPVQLSYLSDAVVLLRYFEGTGRFRRAISVVKKRYGGHERELYLSDGAPRLGPTLRSLRGIFRRMPSFEGDNESLIHDGPPSDAH
jgi:circadian clock protein KaiC